MFHGWENFFYLIGSASAALIGLMFVVITLTAGHEPRMIERGAPVYVAPLVFHLAVVLVMSAFTEVPALSHSAVAAIFISCAVIGLAYSVITTFRLFSRKWEDQAPVLSDKFFYGFFPTLIYLTLLVAAITVWGAPTKAVLAIGVIMLLLLILGIRNAWDLATTLAQRSHERHH